MFVPPPRARYLAWARPAPPSLAHLSRSFRAGARLLPRHRYRLQSRCRGARPGTASCPRGDAFPLGSGERRRAVERSLDAAKSGLSRDAAGTSSGGLVDRGMPSPSRRAHRGLYAAAGTIASLLAVAELPPAVYASHRAPACSLPVLGLGCRGRVVVFSSSTRPRVVPSPSGGLTSPARRSPWRPDGAHRLPRRWRGAGSSSTGVRAVEGWPTPTHASLQTCTRPRKAAPREWWSRAHTPAYSWLARAWRALPSPPLYRRSSRRPLTCRRSRPRRAHDPVGTEATVRGEPAASPFEILAFALPRGAVLYRLPDPGLFPGGCARRSRPSAGDACAGIRSASMPCRHGLEVPPPHGTSCRGGAGARGSSSNLSTRVAPLQREYVERCAPRPPCWCCDVITTRLAAGSEVSSPWRGADLAHTLADAVLLAIAARSPLRAHRRAARAASCAEPLLRWLQPVAIPLRCGLSRRSSRGRCRRLAARRGQRVAAAPLRRPLPAGPLSWARGLLALRFCARGTWSVDDRDQPGIEILPQD